jgi:hypothetical protein
MMKNIKQFEDFVNESMHSKPSKRDYLSEQSLDSKTDNSWGPILNGLKKYDAPKIINLNQNGQPMTTLNWGTLKGEKTNWGLSIGSDKHLAFVTKDELQSKLFQSTLNQLGVMSKVQKNSLSNEFSNDKTILDFSNPQKIINLVIKLIDVLGGKKG